MNIKEVSINLSSRPLSRVQTAKLRKTLQKTIKTVQNKRLSSGNIKTCYQKIHPITSRSNFLSLGLTDNLSNENLQKNKSIIKTRTKSSYCNNRLKEFKKTKLSEIRIQNLFTEKLRYKDKNNKKSFKFSDDMGYKKLIMRAKLLKAAKNNIVLRTKKYEEYINKYSVGNKTLSDKLKNKEHSIDESDSSSGKKKEIPKTNFNLSKNPEVFSTYQTTALFEDYHCTPMELIKKVFNEDERKIIDLDPIFFRLNKEPFCGITKTLGFNLKDKFNEEDRIYKQKMKTCRERKEKLKIIRNKQSSVLFNGKKQTLKNFSDKNIIENKTKNNQTSENKKINNIVYSKDKEVNIAKKNNFSVDYKKNKEYASISLKTSRIKKTEINSFLKNNKKLKNNISSVIYDDDERIKEKNDKLPMEELFEIFNERKKNYLEDLSYNRTKNLFKFETLRKKHRQNLEKENQRKDQLRQLILKIEESYKDNQK